MVSPLLIFVLFAVAVQSSPTSYQPFNAIKQISDIGNNLDPLLETANRKALQNNKILDCDMEEILKTVGLNELQNLIEAVASRKGTNPFAIMKMLYKRMKSHEEIEENLMISLDGIPLPDLSSSPVIETLLKQKSPAVGHTPYSLPSNDPMSTNDEEDTKVVIIPVAPEAPTQNRFPPAVVPDIKIKNEAPFIIGPPVAKMNHVLPVFPVLSPMKSNHLRPPPLGATVRVNSGDARNPLNRDISVTVSPLMTIIEALRQAEIKYQNVLGLHHDMDVITFTHSLAIDCYIVNRINDVVKSDDSGWKITIMDRDGQIVYDGFCLPNAKDVLVKPGTVIYLSYVSL